MSNPSPDTPDHQSPNPQSFKVPAGLLLILLGTLGFMAAFGQMLSYMFYINNWLSVVLSLLQLLVTAAVVGAGAMMLMRRATAERLSPAAGLVGTVALLALDLAGSLVMNGTASGALLPSLTAVPIVILLGVDLLRNRKLPRLHATRGGEPAEAAAAVAAVAGVAAAPAKIAAAPAAAASGPKQATPAKAPAQATKAKRPAPAGKAGPVTSANPINKAKAAGNAGKNTKAKAATQSKAGAPKRPTQARQPGSAGAGRQPGPAKPASKQAAKPAAGAQSKAASAPAKAKPAARSTSGK